MDFLFGRFHYDILWILGTPYLICNRFRSLTPLQVIAGGLTTLPFRMSE